MDTQIASLPKAGQHLTKHVLNLLGVTGEPNHFYEGGYAKTVVTIRDPRDMMISWVRFTQPALTQGYVMSAITDNYCDDIYAYFMDFKRQVDEGDNIILRFEDLVHNPDLTLLADYLGVAVPSDAIDRIICQTATASQGLSKDNLSTLSDHRTNPCWSDLVYATWVNAGGKEICEAYSYE